MKAVFFLVLLMAVSGYSATAEADDLPLRVVMAPSATNIDRSRVYQYCDEQGQRHAINVTYSYTHPGVRAFVMQDPAAQRGLSITMTLGGAQQNVLQTAVDYKVCSREEKAIMVAFVDGNDGCIGIDAPAWAYGSTPTMVFGGGMPVQWNTSIVTTQRHNSDLDPEPLNDGTIYADENSAEVTQYFFHSVDGERVFARMRVHYRKLYDVAILWGKKASDDRMAHVGTADTPEGDEIIVKFQRARSIQA